ncbi:uncharacterized protein UHOD_06053 [Ustilago sp. UG-2017b]|nr:uncharacterized protein UHOD_06053 [Ustilago sp. UG-2017b]
MFAASWTDDVESVRTHDSSMTAIDPPLHHHLSVGDRPQRPLVRYFSDPHFAALPAEMQKSHLTQSAPSKQPATTVQHDRNSSSMSDAHLRVMFPMPSPRNPRSGAINLNSGLEMLDVPGGAAEDALEAAWEDGSCIDAANPLIESTERMGTMKEDKFEVEALRRQVEQLQMALQLQSKQRELEMKLEQQQQNQQHQLLRRRPSQMQQARTTMGYHPQDEWPAQPPTMRSFPQRTVIPNPASLRSTALLNPAHSAAAASLLLNTPLPPAPQEIYQHVSEASPGYNDHLHPTQYQYPDVRRRQSILSQSQSSYSPSLSASQILFESVAAREEEEKKNDDLNRKIDALQYMIQALTHNPTPASTEEGSWEGSDQGSAFRYNPTTARPRWASSAAIRTNPTVTSSAPSITANTAAPSANGVGKGKKGGKLASVFTLGFSKGGSSTDDVTAGLREDVGRVSWSRKRTEKVSVPKAKVRQGPGRGRMVIKETS